MGIQYVFLLIVPVFFGVISIEVRNEGGNEKMEMLGMILETISNAIITATIIAGFITAIGLAVFFAVEGYRLAHNK